MASGKIAPIPKQYSNVINTIDQQLSKNGYARFPGTTQTFLPYKEVSGKYRTGLDDEAAYLDRLPEETREAEKKRIRIDKARLEADLGVPGILDPTSLFWNFAASEADLKAKFGTDVKVSPVKIGNSEVVFDTSSALKEIAWHWIRVHPGIASSLEKYKQGAISADVKYYVVDDEAENTQTYNRKKEINKAIVAFEDMAPTKRKQIARLMGLPITESTKEEVVYNLIDSLLKETEFKDGAHKGLAPVKLFNDLLKTTDSRLKVKDLVEQAITHSIYRFGQGGKLQEGGITIATSKEELVEFLLDEKQQLDLIALEKKLTNKKIEKL